MSKWSKLSAAAKTAASHAKTAGGYTHRFAKKADRKLQDFSDPTMARVRAKADKPRVARPPTQRARSQPSSAGGPAGGTNIYINVGSGGGTRRAARPAQRKKRPQRKRQVLPSMSGSTFY